MQLTGQRGGKKCSYRIRNLLNCVAAQVRDFAGRLPQAGVSIVRPSFIGAVAGNPCPGYVGNLAGGFAISWISLRLGMNKPPPATNTMNFLLGPTGFALAYGLGMFVKGSVAWSNSRMMVRGEGQVKAGEEEFR